MKPTLELQLPPTQHSANPGDLPGCPDFFSPMIERVSKLVDSCRLKCEEPIRSTDHGRDVLVCGSNSETYCDNQNCEIQLCHKHVNHCFSCGVDLCADCSGDHRCES